MEKMYMQVPFDSSRENPLFDGELHRIEIQKMQIVKLSGRIFYVVSCTDYSTSEGIYNVFLAHIVKESLVCVPLDDYSYLDNLLNRYELPEVDISSIGLPKIILLGQMVNAKSLFTSDNRVYAPLEVDEYTCISNGVASTIGSSFSLYNTTVNSDKSEIYRFKKAPSFPIKDDEVLKGYKEGFTNSDGIKKYDFKISVPAGMMGDILMKDSEGGVKTIQVVLMPGEQVYHISYSDYASLEDYESIIRAEDLSVFASWPSYLDAKDSDKAFKNAGTGELTTLGFDANGEVIPFGKKL